MNLGHLVKGQYCWSSHLPSRSAGCYWGRQRLLFLIIACCQKPLVVECFSSGPLTGWGVSWRSCGSKVKENAPCVPSRRHSVPPALSPMGLIVFSIHSLTCCKNSGGLLHRPIYIRNQLACLSAPGSIPLPTTRELLPLLPK